MHLQLSWADNLHKIPFDRNAALSRLHYAKQQRDRSLFLYQTVAAEDNDMNYYIIRGNTDWWALVPIPFRTVLCRSALCSW